MPTNVKIDKIPENVKKSMNPTKNTNLAEKPPKYKSTNVSTSKVVKFEKINLLENRVENVGNVDFDLVRNVVVKPSFGKTVVEEARGSPIEKKEAGSHQIEVRNQKRKRLEESFEDSTRKKVTVVNETIFQSKLARLVRGEGVII